MSLPEKHLPMVFYRSLTGHEPVREWLMAMAIEDRRKLGYEIAVVEFGWPIGMPLCRALGDGLWEVRVALAGNRMARVIFCIAAGHMVLLHGFIKKTRKTPDAEIGLARRRQKELK